MGGGEFGFGEAEAAFGLGGGGEDVQGADVFEEGVGVGIDIDEGEEAMAQKVGGGGGKGFGIVGGGGDFGGFAGGLFALAFELAAMVALDEAFEAGFAGFEAEALRERGDDEFGDDFVGMFFDKLDDLLPSGQGKIVKLAMDEAGRVGVLGRLEWKLGRAGNCRRGRAEFRRRRCFQFGFGRGWGLYFWF